MLIYTFNNNHVPCTYIVNLSGHTCDVDLWFIGAWCLSIVSLYPRPTDSACLVLLGRLARLALELWASDRKPHPRALWPIACHSPLDFTTKHCSRILSSETIFPCTSQRLLTACVSFSLPFVCSCFSTVDSNNFNHHQKVLRLHLHLLVDLTCQQSLRPKVSTSLRISAMICCRTRHSL